MWELSAPRALWRFLISWLSFSLPKHMGVYSRTRVHRFKLDSTTSQLCDLNRLLDCSDDVSSSVKMEKTVPTSQGKMRQFISITLHMVISIQYMLVIIILSLSLSITYYLAKLFSFFLIPYSTHPLLRVRLDHVFILVPHCPQNKPVKVLSQTLQETKFYYYYSQTFLKSVSISRLIISHVSSQ